MVLAGETDDVPFVDLLPLQPPLAEHEVAFVDDQPIVAALPTPTVAGFELNETVGAGTTVIETVFATLPPAPLQVSVKFPLDEGVTAMVPLMLRLPLQLPEAVQLVVPLDDHLIVDVLRAPIVAGLTLIVSDGGGTTVMVTERLLEPPLPEHVIVKLVDPPGATVVDPRTDFDPDQPPDARQSVALVADHDNEAD